MCITCVYIDHTWREGSTNYADLLGQRLDSLDDSADNSSITAFVAVVFWALVVA